MVSRLLYFEGMPPTEMGEIPEEITSVEYANLIQEDRTHRASASATVVEKTTCHRVGGLDGGSVSHG